MKPAPDTTPEPVLDGDLRAYSGYAMKRAFHVVQADLARVLTPLGLRMVTFSALSVIVGNPGIRQTDLARTLLIERPNLVVILDDLERADLITRERVPKDRRAYALTPTLQGQKRYGEARRAVDAHEARMTAQLSETQRQALIYALNAIEAEGGD